MKSSLTVLVGFLAVTGYAFSLSAKAGSLALFLLVVPWCAYVAEDVTEYRRRVYGAKQGRSTRT
jgi:hypothetical protein